MFHLRRIPPNKNAEAGHNSTASLILLDTYVKFGRNPELCDVVLTSSYSSSNMISRSHAEIHGTKSSSGKIDKYSITDHSLNGTYINDKRAKSSCPMNVSEGDIIKFGHMNGASVKELEVSPQANAEFAFVVERYNPAFNYLGFRDGRRVRPIICHGDNMVCTEGDIRNDKRDAANQPKVEPRVMPVIAQPQAPNPNAHAHTTVIPSTTTVNPQLNFFHFPLQYPGLTPNFLNVNPNTIAQWNHFQAGFRAPNVFGNNPLAGVPPSTSASFLPRNYMQQSILTPVTTAAVAAALVQEASRMNQQSPYVQQTTQQAPQPPVAAPFVPQQQQQQPPAVQRMPPQPPQQQQPATVVQPPAPKVAVKEKPTPEVIAVDTTSNDPPPAPSQAAPAPKPPAASPPMECDSSVPSPPKSPQRIEEMKPPQSPVHSKEEDQQSERSFAESPLMRRAPAPAPWDSTPSPRPHTPMDRDVKEKSKSVVRGGKEGGQKHRKANELAGLLDDLTEGSWANQVKRVTSTSRRPTEEAMVEQIAKREKKKKDKEMAKKEEAQKKARETQNPSTSTANNNSRLDIKRRMKQLSDEESVSSDDSDVEPPPPKKETTQKRKPKADSSESEDSEEDFDSDDSSKPRKGKKRARKSMLKPKPAAKAAPTSKGAKKLVKKPSVERESSSDEINSAQAEVDADGKPVVTHDPTANCGLDKQCTHPQDQEVSWVCCDACDTWYHTICILGRDKPPSSKTFFCGCESGQVKKGAKKTKKYARRA